MIGVCRQRPSRRATWHFLLLGLLVAQLAVVEADGFDEIDSLARLVPDSAGLCIEANDLAGTLARLRDGELAKRVGQHPAISAGLARGLAKLSAARALLEVQLGISDADASVLLGGELLIAVWPEMVAGAGGNGLLVLRCRDEQLLKRVAGTIVERQREAGRLASPVTIKSEGRSVEAHAIKTNRADGRAYLTTIGRLAIMATDSRTLVHVVGAVTEFPHDPVLGDMPVYEAASQRLNPDAPLRVFLNPRRWDEQMRALKRPLTGRKAFVQDSIGALWKATDYVAASLSAADSLQLEIFWACQQNRLSEPLRTVLGSLAGPSEMASRLPPKCLAAVAGRLDLGRMITALLDSEVLGKYDLQPPVSLAPAAIMALAGCLGPEVGVAVLPPTISDATGQASVPWLAGIETHGIEGGRDGPSAAAWFVPWLRETVRLSSAASKTRGQQPAMRSSLTKHDGIELTGIAGLPQLPAGETLFVANEHGLLWLGNSAQLTTQAAKEPLSKPTANHRYDTLRHPRLDAPSGVLLLDLAEFRRAADKWPAPAAGGRGLLKADKLTDLKALAALADCVLVQVQCDPAGTAISLHVACD